MSFKSDKQRKAVMAIMKASKAQRVYHLSASSKALTKKGWKYDRILHVGTKQAALDRIESLGYELYHSDQNPKEYRLYEMLLNPRKPLVTRNRTADWLKGADFGTRRLFNEGISRDVDRMDQLFRQGEYTGGGYGRPPHGHIPGSVSGSGDQRLYDRLRRRGYDTVPYINVNEHPGHFSWGVLSPKAVKKIKLIKRIPYVPPRSKRS